MEAFSTPDTPNDSIPKRGYMISNQVLQNTIDGMKSIARGELCVMDADGKEVAFTTDMSSSFRFSYYYITNGSSL